MILLEVFKWINRRGKFIDKILSTFILGLSFEFDWWLLAACTQLLQLFINSCAYQAVAAVQVGVGRQWQASCPVNNYDDSKKCWSNNNEECWFILCYRLT